MRIQRGRSNLIAENPLPALAVSCEGLVDIAEEGRSLGFGALDRIGSEGLGLSRAPAWEVVLEEREVERWTTRGEDVLF